MDISKSKYAIDILMMLFATAYLLSSLFRITNILDQSAIVLLQSAAALLLSATVLIYTLKNIDEIYTSTKSIIFEAKLKLKK